VPAEALPAGAEAAEPRHQLVRLEWSPAEASATAGYRVWSRLAHSGAEWQVLVENTCSPEPAVTCSLPRGEQFEFRVAAVAPDGLLCEAEAAAAPAQRLPDIVQGLRVEECAADGAGAEGPSVSLRVSWAAPIAWSEDDGPIVQYRIAVFGGGSTHVGAGGRQPMHQTCVEAPACEAVMTGFLRGSGYTFTAAAVTALGAGAEATAGFDVPSLLAAAPPGPARVGDVLSEAQRAFCERMRQRWGNPSNQCLGLCLNRGSLFEDSVAVLGAPGAAEEYLQAHQMLQVQFEGEAGVDEGGLLREWLCIACQEGCRPDRGVFERLQAGHVWPSAVGWGVAQEEAKLVLRLLGRLVGIALASGHSIGFAVHPIFWQWAFPAAPDEEVDYFLALRHFDREQFVHRARLVCTRGQMAAALGADGEEELEVLLPGWRPLDGDEVAELELTWDYHDTVCGTPLSTPLLPEGGAAAAVTKDRAAEYLRLWSRQRIVGCVEGALATLRDGILEVVPGEALRRLTPAELGQLAAGVVDWRPEELLRHLQVVAVCDAAGSDNGGEVSRMVRQLGEVLGAFSGHQREAFLRYVTGSPCLPAGGAAALRPRPTLQVIRTWSTETLPVAHTCANMLDMPLYPDADTLRSRLLTALHFGTDGFGLA